MKLIDFSQSELYNFVISVGGAGVSQTSSKQELINAIPLQPLQLLVLSATGDGGDLTEESHKTYSKKFCLGFSNREGFFVKKDLNAVIASLRKSTVSRSSKKSKRTRKSKKSMKSKNSKRSRKSKKSMKSMKSKKSKKSKRSRKSRKSRKSKKSKRSRKSRRR
jgi:hypothetical protein